MAPEDLDMEPDMQLLVYAKERAVTWDDLKSRSPLFPGEEGGMWQFSSAEQVIRGECHTSLGWSLPSVILQVCSCFYLHPQTVSINIQMDQALLA